MQGSTNDSAVGLLAETFILALQGTKTNALILPSLRTAGLLNSWTRTEAGCMEFGTSCLAVHLHVSRFEYSFYANSANIKNAAVSMWPVSTSSMTMPKEYTFGQLTGVGHCLQEPEQAKERFLLSANQIEGGLFPLPRMIRCSVASARREDLLDSTVRIRAEMSGCSP